MKKGISSQAELRSILTYHPDNGQFIANCRRGKMKAGQVLGHLHSSGYVNICINRKLYRAHRLAWLYVTGAWPKAGIDHENGNTSDNRWDNLRDATQSQNMHNARLRKDNTSGVKGVSWHSTNKMWRVRLWLKGQEILVGYFEDLELAEFVAQEYRTLRHGEFARHC